MGSAQEGGLRAFTDSTLRLVLNTFTAPQESSADLEQEVTEPSEQEVKPDPVPRSYPNGFTEGDVLESTGVPTYSSEEFVPSGADAPKEGEIDPCITSDNYDACVQQSFDDFWEAQQPEGEGWEEIRIGDAPVAWNNEELNTFRSHGRFFEYLDENMHKYVSGAKSEVSINYFQENGATDIEIEWRPLMQLSGYNYFHRINRTFAEQAAFKAVLTTSDGERINLHNPHNETFLLYEESLGYAAETSGPFQFRLPYLEPCTSGLIESSIVINDGREFDLNPVSLEVPAPEGLSCSSPSLDYLNMPFGWVFQVEDGDLVLDSVYLNSAAASLYGVDPDGLENSLVSIKAPSNYAFEFYVTEVESYGPRVDLYFDSQSRRLRGDFPYGTYEVTLWLMNAEGVITTFSLKDVEITDDRNFADIYFSVSKRP